MHALPCRCVPRGDLPCINADAEWGAPVPAAEAAREVVKPGFERYRLPRIVAFINLDNVAPVRVAEQAGVKYAWGVTSRDFGRVAPYAKAPGRAEAGV